MCRVVGMRVRVRGSELTSKKTRRSVSLITFFNNVLAFHCSFRLDNILNDDIARHTLNYTVWFFIVTKFSVRGAGY